MSTARKKPRAAAASTSGFDAWKAKAQRHADEHPCLSLGDIWAPGDDYEILAPGRAAYLRGDAAEDFVEEMFAEDIARTQYDAELEAQSEAYGEFEDDE